ncbi:eukaryotic type KH-domain type I [Pelomyxa schiedti]|nr:eukaryotic type KH-domain type I [Pelomyxa schiedti]
MSTPSRRSRSKWDVPATAPSTVNNASATTTTRSAADLAPDTNTSKTPSAASVSTTNTTTATVGSNDGADPSATLASPDVVAALTAAVAHAASLAKGVPPAESNTTQVALTAAAAADRINKLLSDKGLVKKQVDGYSKDIIINDCKPEVRYILTKGTTHEQLYRDTGASVITRGKFRNQPSTLASLSEPDPPLYLHVSGETQEVIEKASAQIESIMSTGTIAGLVAKVYLGIENPDKDFGVVPRILGPKGSYVKHITTETRAKVQLHGQGSGFVEPGSNQESPEPLHILIQAPTQSSLDSAKALAESLVGHVRDEHKSYLDNKLKSPVPSPVPGAMGYPMMPGYYPYPGGSFYPYQQPYGVYPGGYPPYGAYLPPGQTPMPTQPPTNPYLGYYTQNTTPATSTSSTTPQPLQPQQDATEQSHSATSNSQNPPASSEEEEQLPTKRRFQEKESDTKTSVPGPQLPPDGVPIEMYPQPEAERPKSPESKKSKVKYDKAPSQTSSSPSTVPPPSGRAFWAVSADQASNNVFAPNTADQPAKQPKPQLP